MRTCDKLGDIRAHVEANHGCLKNYRLFLDKGKKPPRPGEEVRDFDMTLEEAGFIGGKLDSKRPIARPENATTSGVLHCEFVPTARGSLLEIDSLVMVNGKMTCSLDATTREESQIDKRKQKEEEEERKAREAES
jgi:hypothetical protein